MIKRPIISERSMELAKGGLYTFEVYKWATKKDIAKMVSDEFKVKVVSVKTINVKPKTKQQRSRRGYFQTQAIKKALVQVKKGDKIPLFEVGKDKGVEVKTAESEVAKEKVAKPKEKVKKVAKPATKGKPKTTKEKSIDKKSSKAKAGKK